ncbi:MAG: dihydropteroate synthase [Candidatus Omnitrophica bacterium]|nr:dihydropteroate synthase [Candidatus Omnitrophota bacterium]
MRVIPIDVKNLTHAYKIMDSLGVDREGIKIMAPKGIFRVFKIEEIDSVAANIVKQHLLSLGAEAGLPRGALTKKTSTEMIIFATLSQLKRVIPKLKRQEFGLKELGEKLATLVKEKKNHLLVARDKKVLIKKPIVCGIINLTPDSFSGDGIFKESLHSSPKTKYIVLKKVEAMVKNGAKMIDIGGESSRPFSQRISPEEEIKRVIPYFKEIRKRFPSILLSIDTYKYGVAKEAVNEGADIINDITALRESPQILSLVKKYRLGCILMHMKGTPQTMQISPFYKDVVREIISFLEERVDFCLRRRIEKTQLLIDPGIGFGKRLQDNIEILARLREFKTLGLPIFLGVFRKSFIGQILNLPLEERLIGSVAAVIWAVLKGANILRVHDVKETYQALKIIERLARN